MYFVNCHKLCESSSNFTTGRVLHYPPLPAAMEIKPGQLRCGEHVDYGSITLLFQDPNGGLQVCVCWSELSIILRFKSLCIYKKTCLAVYLSLGVEF